ncbi:Flp pilus assembly protein CpaB [Thermoflexus sp.]|uniref:Flp pilus assembly protein CpaB n=1 Tax=Thermoflexus sp. TaxID=1969742 RepID=UPI002ADD77EB|nr:Flp pilus assembly protein CpaB [Thermoflexus sp.]
MRRNVLLTAGVALATFLLTAAFLAAVRNTRPTLVAARALPPGTRLTEADVVVRQIPASARLPGALSDPKEAVGRVLSFARAEGDQITAAMLGEGPTGIAAALSPEARAVAVKVDQSSGLLGILRPGDRVTVIAVVDPGALGFERSLLPAPSPGREVTGTVGTPPAGPAARVVLSGLKVLMVPASFRYEEASPSQGGPAALAPLRALSAQQGVVLLEAPVEPVEVAPGLRISPVELLALLDAKARIHLALEPPEGGRPASVGITLERIAAFAGGQP